MLFDSHCHLDFPALLEDRDAVLARAVAAGVDAILVPGVDEAQWARAGGLIGEPRIDLRFAVGLHPSEAPTWSEARVASVASAAERLDAVAIGELGWDARDGADLDAQDALGDAQLALARELDLPVILHVVGAHGHALERLARHGPLRGVVHSYSGSAELVGRYVALGLSIGIGASVTRPGARKAVEAARAVPLDRLLIETDAPDQAPEPADVARVAEAVAKARGIPIERVAETSRANARALFAARAEERDR